MSLTPVIYRVASLAAGRRLLQGLSAALPARKVEPLTRRATLYDTFDWRICHDDGMLALEADGFLVWTTTAGLLRYRIPAQAAPAFAWDLPDSPVRRELERVIEMRRLLPVAQLELTCRGVDVLDDLEKTVCRVTLESGKAGAPPGQGATRFRRLPPMLRVAPIRGYPEAFGGVLRRLDTELGVARSDASELRRVMRAVGREPCDVPARQTYDVHPGMRADAAMKAIHRGLLATFRRNEAGMRQDLDSEFLHDARVAVRRTRSALTQVPGVFPGDDVRRFKREFRWLGGITGPTRDLDVYLLKIPGYRAALDRRHRTELDPLVDLLRERQQEAQRRLVADLDSPRFEELMRNWETFLAEPTPRVSGLPDAMRPIDDVAGERIWRAWRKVLKRGRQIGPDSAAELLHRLRIDCKKLRYLLEFFSALYPAEEIKGLIGALKKLQNNLGDLNDLAVQAQALREFEQALAERGIGQATLTAIERLVEQLEERRVSERASFEARFAEFSSEPVADAFRRLFRPPADVVT